MMHVRRGFALIELIVMILLLLVLSSSVAVYYRQMMDENRLQIVQNDLAFLRRQVVIHRMKHTAPLTSLAQLEHLKDDSLTDPWGHEYVLLEGTPPRIASVGADGELDAADATAGDDIQLALTEAVTQEGLPAAPVAPGQGVVEGAAAAYEVTWLNPARAAGASPRVERLEPCPASTRPVPPGFDRALCHSATQGPAIYLAVALRRRADTRPNTAADRLAMQNEAGDLALQLELTTPRGSERLDAQPVDRLPCCVAERLYTDSTTRSRLVDKLLAAADWYLLLEAPAATLGETAFESVFYRFYRATLPEEPCTGTYHAQVSVEQTSRRAILTSSTLSYTVLEPPQLHLDSTTPVANVVASPLPPAVDLVFSGEDARLVCSMLNGQMASGMEIHFETTLDGRPLPKQGAAVMLDENRFQLKLDWPAPNPPGSHVLKTRLFYRTYESPGGHTLCREWTYSS